MGVPPGWPHQAQHFLQYMCGWCVEVSTGFTVERVMPGLTGEPALRMWHFLARMYHSGKNSKPQVEKEMFPLVRTPQPVSLHDTGQGEVEN